MGIFYPSKKKSKIPLPEAAICYLPVTINDASYRVSIPICFCFVCMRRLISFSPERNERSIFTNKASR